MNASERSLVTAALDIFAVGGNGEGWILTDAIDCLRVALGEADVGERWLVPVDRERLAQIVGDVAYYVGNPGE